jgi:hypothetical protein
VKTTKQCSIAFAWYRNIPKAGYRCDVAEIDQEFTYIKLTNILPEALAFVDEVS